MTLEGVHPFIIFIEHSFDGKFVFGSQDGCPHHTYPFFRTLIVGWHHFMEEYIVECLEVVGVLFGDIIAFEAIGELPASHAVFAGLRPPAIEDAEVEYAIHGGFHARCAAGFLGASGVVEPDIGTPGQGGAGSHIVVFDKDDGVGVFFGHGDQFADQSFAGIVQRVGLS